MVKISQLILDSLLILILFLNIPFSIALITNQSGDIVENTFYMPYGEVTSGGEERFGYTSKEKDAETECENKNTLNL